MSENEIDLEKLGELGQSIIDFDYENFRNENIEFLEELYNYYNFSLKYNGLERERDIKNALKIQSKITEILNDEEYLNYLVNKRLDSVVDGIIKGIYALKDFNHVDKAGMYKKLSDEEYEIPILSAKNKKIKSAPIAEELCKIRLDDLRKCLFDTVGFEFTPLSELYKMRMEAVSIEDKAVIKDIWSKNGFNNHYVQGLVLDTDRDPLFDDPYYFSFFYEDRIYHVKPYKGNISKFANKSKRKNMSLD